MMMTCLMCGGELERVRLSGEHAPWLCSRCRHAWWEAELSPEARRLWRRSKRDFGHRGEVAEAVALERRHALIPSKGAP
jgi:transposase-like protein